MDGLSAATAAAAPKMFLLLSPLLPAALLDIHSNVTYSFGSASLGCLQSLAACGYCFVIIAAMTIDMMISSPLQASMIVLAAVWIQLT